MGKSRAFVAALAATGVVLSGCASADGGEETSTTTSPTVAEEPGNPWDLPIEQRPALFDPCAEIPIEAIEEGVGGAVDMNEGLRNHKPGELFTCGWNNKEVLFGVLATWRSKKEFISDDRFGPVDTQSTVLGRPGFRASDRTDLRDDTCYQMFFTSRGAVVVNLNLRTAMREFRGGSFQKACDVLDRTIEPVMNYFPGGDY